MLLMKDVPFASDPNFAYVCFNAIQRKQTSTSITFHFAENQYEFADTLLESQGRLEALQKRNAEAAPTSARERRLIDAINQLRFMCKDVKGSNAARTRMRARVRAMIWRRFQSLYTRDCQL